MNSVHESAGSQDPRSDRRLPRSLPALASFDAAARHGSFTAAARELGVGQPAISHAIRQLEDDLGEPLFIRRHRGVALTETGRQLADAVRQGLSIIDDGIAELRRHQARSGRTVTIGASTATAAHWLIPRLARFKLGSPSIDVRCITSDTNTFDLDQVDLFIPVGRGDWPHRERWEVAREVVYPICSATHARSLGPVPLSLDELADQPLLHVEERHRSRLTWGQWFQALGAARWPAPGATVGNDYTVLLQAVQAGQGIALGWDHIVAELVEQGTLVRPVVEAVHTNRPIYLHAPPGRIGSSEVDEVCAWLTAGALPAGSVR